MFPHKRIHCIGIGGIGISAIAKLLHAQGAMVTGSDAADSDIVQDLIARGIIVSTPVASEDVVVAAEAIVYSEAVPEDQAERVLARAKGIPEYAGGAFLALLTQKHKTICVAGTHGKSTTTAMIGLVLEAAGLDPTVIVGSKVPQFALGNVRVGKGEWLVLEADEYRKKFLQYKSQIAVVTSVETDHVDIYGSEKELTDAFAEFTGKVAADGAVVIHHDAATKIPAGTTRRLVYGTEEGNDVRVQGMVHSGLGQSGTVSLPGQADMPVDLAIPGSMNVENALAAFGVASVLGIDSTITAEALKNFRGIWRRFEVVGNAGPASYHGAEPRPIIISDYAHHPTAVRRTIEAARAAYPGQRIVAVFQPHQRSRTAALFADFVEACATADVAVLTDVYAVRGRDEEHPRATSEQLVTDINVKRPGLAHYGGTLAQTREKTAALLQAGDVVLVMGAGDVDEIARHLVRAP